MGPKGSGDAKQATQITITASIEGVEFIYEDPNLQPKKIALYKTKESNTVEVGRRLLAPGNKKLGFQHVRLTFQDSKVSITYLGSGNGTWVQSKKACLVKDKSHTLKDGDRIVFGAEEDAGLAKDPDAVRVKVKFLTEGPPQAKAPPSPKKTPPPSPKSALLEAPAAKSPRPGTPDAKLQPPQNNHRRANSLSAQGKSKEFAVAAKAPAPPVQTPHTILDTHIKVPWSETFRLGFGVNALTGEFTASSALRRTKFEETSEPGASHISVERLQWDGVKELRDEFEMKAGATMNLPCPLGANARIASVLSNNTSTSTILIQYKVHSDFAPYYIPEGVQLKDGLENVPDKKFREQFGDYYIAGVQRSYSCRMIVVCEIKEQRITESHAKEAAALVDKYFKVGIKAIEEELQTSSISLTRVIVDAEGCSPNLSSVFDVAVKDGPKTLSMLKNAPGVRRVAYLYHYSRISSSNLSPHVDVSKAMFKKVQSMRGIYAHLQSSLHHPALRKFDYDRRTIDRVLKRFEDQRRSIVYATKGDNKADALLKDLTNAKEKADALMRRYDFIRIVRDMDKTDIPHSSTPVDGGFTFHRWECGMVNAARKVTSLDSPKTYNHNLVSFEPGDYKAFQLEWETPVTDGTSTLHQLLHPSTPPREAVSFQTQSSGQVMPPPPPSPSPSKKLAKLPPVGITQKGAEPDKGVFTLVLADHQPCYVLGWSLSCYWPEGKSEPTIDVDEQRCILSDRLTVLVDNSRAAKWYCKVTFVIQSAYNFPDLRV